MQTDELTFHELPGEGPSNMIWNMWKKGRIKYANYRAYESPLAVPVMRSIIAITFQVFRKSGSNISRENPQICGKSNFRTRKR